MTRMPQGTLGVLFTLIFVGALSGCASGASSSPPVMAPGTGLVGAGSAAAIAAADKQATQYTEADAEFMTGMIPHHAQAILMSRMCPTHGARLDIKLFCEKIIVAQTDEIRLMRGWLKDRSLPVPDSMATRHVMKMNGMVHEMLMPGMLTDSQLVELDKARGSAFDRLFLTGMIGHHQGAIDMVRTLFATDGAAQENVVFRFATDVLSDQSAEIERMQVMLQTVPPE